MDFSWILTWEGFTGISVMLMTAAVCFLFRAKQLRMRSLHGKRGQVPSGMTLRESMDRFGATAD